MNYSDYADKGQAQVISLLKQKLSAEKWREADELTKILMLKTSNNKRGSYLSLNINSFPSDVLEEIDELWRYKSNYRFGFSVQKNIFNSKNYSDFISKVGWHTGDSWLSYSHLSFAENAPQGHLPYCGWHFWQSVDINKGSSSSSSSSSHKTHFHRPHPSHQHSDNNAGAAAGIGAVAMAAAPWLIGAAVVGGAGYLIYREATKEERKRKERLEKERQETEEKQRLLKEENKVEKNIGSLLALV